MWQKNWSCLFLYFSRLVFEHRKKKYSNSFLFEYFCETACIQRARYHVNILAITLIIADRNRLLSACCEIRSRAPGKLRSVGQYFLDEINIEKNRTLKQPVGRRSLKMIDANCDRFSYLVQYIRTCWETIRSIFQFRMGIYNRGGCEPTFKSL